MCVCVCVCMWVCLGNVTSADLALGQAYLSKLFQRHVMNRACGAFLALSL